MKIEPEALYSLFDTLFLPTENVAKTDKDIDKMPSNKKVLMLFDKELTQEESDFLNKILAAIQIKDEEAEANFKVTPETLPEIINDSSGYILVWGIDYPGTERYKLTKTGGASIIVSDAINEVQNDQSLKAKLWKCLKETFVR